MTWGQVLAVAMICHDWWLTDPSEKYIRSSVGMMKFQIYGKIKKFQTTNQIKT
jgi:hypothetical protein